MCEHVEKFQMPQVFKNGTVHIREECKSCKKFIRYVPQKVDTENYILYFGQHRGKKLKDIPRSYLEWVVKQEDFYCRKRIKDIVKQYLEEYKS